ncbi:MAG: hypothetical protein WAU31_02385 [Candidatus Moraniibacteriota bacterium]
MIQRSFVFMPTDSPNRLIIAAVKERMTSNLGWLLALDAHNTWSNPREAVQDLLSLLYSVDLAMSKTGKEFQGNEDVAAMLREWAISSPKMLQYLTNFSSQAENTDLSEISHWFAFLTVRRQTLELNGISVPSTEESPVQQV